MGIQYGHKKVNGTGLIQHLDAGDLTSYPGDPTTNFVGSVQQAYSTIEIGNFGIIDAPSTQFTTTSITTKPPTGGLYFGHKIISITNSSGSTNRNHYYGFQFFPSTGSAIASRVFTLSVYVKGPAGMRVGTILTSANEWFTQGGGSADHVLTGDWQRVSCSATFTASATGNSVNCRLSTYGASPNGNVGTAADIGVEYFYSSIQVEEKSAMTPFTDSSRSTTNIWKDLTGNNNHASFNTVTGITYSSANRGKLVLASTYQVNTLLNLASSPYTVIASARRTSGSGRVTTALNNNWLLGHWSTGTQSHYAEGWVGGSGGTVSDTNWRIYAATGGLANNYAEYVNGALVYGVNNLGTAGPNCLGFGCYPSEPSTSEVGFLMIYNRILTSTEIAAQFEAQRERYSL